MVRHKPYERKHESTISTIRRKIIQKKEEILDLELQLASARKCYENSKFDLSDTSNKTPVDQKTLMVDATRTHKEKIRGLTNEAKFLMDAFVAQLAVAIL